ncbi:pectate lyase [Alteromonadaceae bacterium Bs31]|nr:pectate lyase [Alteromonadaceae bacterium Bs31]
MYEVTTLEAKGAGSLDEALKASGPRTVVFRVGGTIKGNFSISNDDITIAGQTAPGDGIAIHGSLRVAADNVIIRYIRVRGTASGDTISNNKNSPNRYQVYDHISTNWSSDEVFSIYFNEYVTIQYSMITEANSSDHKFGGIWGNNYSTYHHNLFAHNQDRVSRFASGSGYNDFRNNVIYNWSGLGTYGCENQQVGDSEHVFCNANVVANYYKPGPATPSNYRAITPTTRNGASDYGKWYVADNYFYGNDAATADNWLAVIPHYWEKIDRDLDAIAGLRVDTPSEYMPINQQTAVEAYQTVLDDVGTSLPRRDALDARIIEEVRTGTAINGNGHISSPGTLPDLQGNSAPLDSDHDGMPDDWEVANGLNPNDASDRNNTDSIGYTMLENYLNSIDSL